MPSGLQPTKFFMRLKWSKGHGFLGGKWWSKMINIAQRAKNET
jgi:hypothetical protein